MNMMHPKLKWVLPTLAVVMLTVVFLLSSTDLQRTLPAPLTQPIRAAALVANISSDFLVHTSGCRIPYMNAFDPGIRKYVKRVENIQCSTAGALIMSNQTSIWINQYAEQFNNFSIDEIKCCHQSIFRKVMKKPNKNINADSNVVGAKACTDFKGSTDIHDEFIKVKCFLNGTKIHTDYHAFIVHKQPPQSKLPPATELDPEATKERKLNVLMIGMDAVSRLNFYRQMPRTLQLLRSMKAIELLGYNKVDDNTFPNLVPVLSGKSVEELRQSCWKNDNDVFDDCPFIWKLFHNEGYQTGFGEDACWMGTFQYLKQGFFKQPVDNYFHTFMIRAEEEIGHARKMNARLCVGPRLAGQVLFDYAAKFSLNLTNSEIPYFGFFWGTSLTHDYLNVQPQTDSIYENLLRQLAVNNVLENTAVVVMSDHGIRWGPIRETYQGRVEERLPLVYFMLPQWFQDTYPNAVMNLKRNTKMLTSPFDLHETLSDMASLSSLTRASLARRAPRETSARGVSLFLPVPDNRTCDDAGITANWCTCHQTSNISLDDPVVNRAALTVVDHLNEKLFSYIQCSQLSLLEVKSALLEAPHAQVKSSSSRAIQDVTVLLVTTPGLAEFEATVRHRVQEDALSVLGYVSRINTYGSQSKCVDNFQMRLYCYCL